MVSATGTVSVREEQGAFASARPAAGGDAVPVAVAPSPTVRGYAAAEQILAKQAAERAQRAVAAREARIQATQRRREAAAAQTAWRLSDLPKMDALASLAVEFADLKAALAAGGGRIILGAHETDTGYIRRLFVLDGGGIKSVKADLDVRYEFNPPVYIQERTIRGGPFGRLTAWLRGVTNKSIVRYADPEVFRKILQREHAKLAEVERTAKLPDEWLRPYEWVWSRKPEWTFGDGRIHLDVLPEHRDLLPARR